MSTDVNPKITLEVGGQTFITTKSTLTHGQTEGSKYFEKRFNFENNNQSQRRSEISDGTSQQGSYSFDFDVETFRHILDYLRTGVFPFLWTRSTGVFDYLAYAKIERLADYLQIEQLKLWIERNKFEKVVQYETRCTRLPFRCDRASKFTAHHVSSSHVTSTELTIMYKQETTGFATNLTEKSTVIRKRFLVDFDYKG
ncbi:hypothetical protein BT63DRAFT_427220 [Microthyrium microscopicum]|uniref:BTB domain-containing protein n=1 Tax=Microthyrium microscopicum TaxID=703497 RepID=A0A6A6U6U6_9PEZI|nr:hypothetical protein BT63DRAFT_427220 [Microthyrium microscopicum]